MHERGDASSGARRAVRTKSGQIGAGCKRRGADVDQHFSRPRPRISDILCHQRLSVVNQTNGAQRAHLDMGKDSTA